MPEEIIENEDTEEPIDYIAKIQEIKENTVAKEKYSKLVKENKQLIEALVNGQQIETQEPPRGIEELRKAFFSKDADKFNIDYVRDALDLRDAIIENGMPDPFLPVGSNITITADMRDTAERVAQGLRECVDASEGDPSLFTAQLQRMLRDPIPIKSRAR